MWTLLLFGLSVAGAPASVDLNDIDHWESAADRVLEGPAGCWEFVGQASWNWEFGRWGASRGDMVFMSRMVDGVWQAFHLEPLGEVTRSRRESEQRIYGYEPRFVPLVGRIDGRIEVSNPDTRDQVGVEPDPPSKEEERRSERQERRRERRRGDDDEDDGPENVVRAALDRLGGSAISSWAQWDEDRGSVVLFRSVPIGDGARAPAAEETIQFPGGEAPVALDIAFPKTFYVGSLPRYRVSDAVVHVRVRSSGGELFPTSESYKVEFGVLGFTFTGAQTIRYKSARRCATAPPVAE